MTQKTNLKFKNNFIFLVSLFVLKYSPLYGAVDRVNSVAVVREPFSPGPIFCDQICEQNSEQSNLYEIYNSAEIQNLNSSDAAINNIEGLSVKNIDLSKNFNIDTQNLIRDKIYSKVTYIPGAFNQKLHYQLPDTIIKIEPKVQEVPENGYELLYSLIANQIISNKKSPLLNIGGESSRRLLEEISKQRKVLIFLNTKINSSKNMSICSSGFPNSNGKVDSSECETKSLQDWEKEIQDTISYITYTVNRESKGDSGNGIEQDSIPQTECKSSVKNKNPTVCFEEIINLVKDIDPEIKPYSVTEFESSSTKIQNGIKFVVPEFLGSGDLHHLDKCDNFAYSISKANRNQKRLEIKRIVLDCKPLSALDFKNYWSESRQKKSSGPKVTPVRKENLQMATLQNHQ